jgi:hypothetical protein
MTASCAEDERSVSLPSSTLFGTFRACQFEDDLVKGSFAGYGLYLNFDYQELFRRQGAEASEACLSRFAAWLGIGNQFADREPRHRKLANLPLTDAVSNFDDVVTALRGTEFEYCLDDEAIYRSRD